ncbi:MAG: hydrogenase maturation protease, partial [Proteobacteria bacterium]|nr:hydrogenase maturation protease [Pseudomonadota bacterium]
LLGDDGFGPEVIKALEARHILTDDIGVLDAGTSFRELLFDLLLCAKIPRTLILIDAIQYSNALPGDILCINIDQIPENKVADYSLHQFPAMNMLKELKELSLIDIQIYAVQIDYIPLEVKPGLSDPVKKAVDKMCCLIKRAVYDPNYRFCAGQVPSC